ncbi:MAG: GFA family protein [Francisellaceae bacterium]
MTKSKYSASCLCGQVNFTLDEDPLFMCNCHCKDCQRWTGSGYAPVNVFPNATLKSEGKIRFFDKASDNGNTISRGFCPHCGGNVMAKSDGFPDYVMVAAGVLDDSSRYKPAMDIYTENTLSWDIMHKETKKFPREPG